ncbi:MarR family transcriptional regulator [Clostridium sp. KNHs214]|uniref:MarR family winged helix-turn-helix transcriptional regulator n=1 Tax=Clostridium sp. KNHs214 TaxID=1540257 RepID=UPI0005524E7D|nr:MarR family transcriptional regulator [Clostridium sp. KNHs214]
MINNYKSEKVIGYLDEIQNIIHNKHHDLAQKYNLTLEQFHLLLHLSMKSTPPTVNEIANSFNNAQNTMSEKLSRLQEKKFIKKIKDPNDKRVSKISLSIQGKKLIDTICYEAENCFVKDAISKMEEQKLQTLILCLEDLIKNLKEE